MQTTDALMRKHIPCPPSTSWMVKKVTHSNQAVACSNTACLVDRLSCTLNLTSWGCHHDHKCQHRKWAVPNRLARILDQAESSV